MDDLKDFLVEWVIEHQGVKGGELVVAGTVRFGEKFKLEVLEELVQEGRLVEIEYVLPSMDYRVKSFYLPGGAKTTVRWFENSMTHLNGWQPDHYPNPARSIYVGNCARCKEPFGLRMNEQYAEVSDGLIHVECMREGENIA